MIEISHRHIALKRADIVDSKRNQPLLQCPNYIEYDMSGSVIMKVSCKVCGVPLKSMVPVDSMTESFEVNNKIIIHERTVLAHTNMYDVLTIEFKDNTAHQTPICKKCKQDIKEDWLEDLYVCDLRQFAKDEDLGHGQAPWNILAYKEIRGVGNGRGAL